MREAAKFIAPSTLFRPRAFGRLLIHLAARLRSAFRARRTLARIAALDAWQLDDSA